MANLEVQGKLLHKLPVQSGTSARGPWEKQEFVIEMVDGNFPTKAAFSVWGADKVKELAGINEGTEIKVSFNLSSREYNGRWYTDVRAWRITPVTASAPYQGDAPAGFGPSAPAPTMDNFSSVDVGDDLPF